MIVHFGVFQILPYNFGVFRYFSVFIQTDRKETEYTDILPNVPKYTEKHVENTVIYVLYNHIPKSVTNIHQICSKHASEF